MGWLNDGEQKKKLFLEMYGKTKVKVQIIQINYNSSPFAGDGEVRMINGQKESE